uniref:Putative ribonuclease H-like domain-containing protein n=1 Tax=Tanacetum cinerariifolium TaxID=118510 RepID=A0A6L2K4J7_TANCI|nr:putative ribonuclease H-like domain-containing protein [Tanacetum cinerariifolium]GEU42995.1 putative ribonuclease H-like domain-containing protein [Tanacetum cinerariifolium]
MKMGIMFEPTSNKLLVERFDTTSGNPVKEIVLKLNLLDHRILKDGGEECSSNNSLTKTTSLSITLYVVRYSSTVIEEWKDLTSLSLDDLIGNLKVYEMIIMKYSKSVKAKVERKSLALKAKKESRYEECLTSRSKDKEYAMAVRDFKKFFKRKGKFVRQPRNDKKTFQRSRDDKNDKNQRAFVGGSWSDSGEEDDEKVKNETCFVAQASSVNGNGPVSVTTDTNGMIKVLPPKTTKEVVARERDRKARTTFTNGLTRRPFRKVPEMVDAKEICFSVSASEGLHKGYDSASQLDYDDLEQINDDDMEEMDLKWQVAMISMWIKKFHKRTGRKLQFDTKDPISFDKTKVECFNCHKMKHFARDCRTKRNQDSRRRDAGHVEEDAQNYAMIAYSSSNSGSDNEESDLENTFVNDRYAARMHVVPPPMTGNYMPFGLDVEIDYSKFTYGPKQTLVDESDSKTSEYTSCESDSSLETPTSMPTLVENAPKVVCEPKVWTDAPIIEEYESDSDNDQCLMQAASTSTASKVNTARPFVNETRPKSAVKGNGDTVVKASAGCNLRNKRNSWNKDDPHRALKDKGIVDSGCSNGRITGRGKIKAGKLDFEDVYYVEELKNYNLFFVSQIQHNMYSFNLKNVDPSRDLASLFSKASIDESNKWHRRLGHVNFKNLNKLVKGNLVRVENQANKSACSKEANNSASIQANDDQSANSEDEHFVLQDQANDEHFDQKKLTIVQEINLHDKHFVLPIWSAYSTTVKSSGDKIEKNTDFESPRKEATHDIQSANTNSINLLNYVSTLISTAGPSRAFNDVEPLYPDDPLMPHLEDIYASPSEGIFTDSSYNDEGVVWILVDLPFGKKAIGTKWVYKNKKDERGVVVRNKARLVAQGHRQEEGIDYYDVFAPVARIEVIRIFFTFASYMGFIVYQMDMKSAFLYGTIYKEVYVTQPLGFVDPKFPNKVYKVVKALYGLHQAPRAWYATLPTFLEKSGYKKGAIDKTLFIKQDKKDIMLVQVYVDDIIFGLTKKSWCDEFEELMKNGVKTASTPIETQKPLVKDKEAADVDVHLYRSMIGSLMYLTASRPDIKYLKGQPKLGLWHPKVSSFNPKAYSDSDYAGANLDRKSTTRGCQFLGRRLISWQCKKQTIVATYTTKTEYVAAAHCYEQVLWIQNQLLDYGFNIMNIKIYIDNESTICIVKNPVFYSKTKHIEIQHHFIRDAYEKKLIQVLKIHTDDNVADLLIKAVDISRFNFLIVDFLNAQVIHYALMVNPTIYVSCIKQFWATVSIKKANDVVKSVGKGFSGVETPLFATMIIQPQAKVEEDEVAVPNAPTPPSPTTAPSLPLQDPITIPPQAQPTTPSSPPHAQPTDTSKSSLTLLNTLMETWGRIEAIDADKDITLVDAETQVDAELQGRKDDNNDAIKDLKAVEVSGSHSTQDTPTDNPKEMSEKDVQNMLEIVLVSEFKVEALQVKSIPEFEDMLKGFDREDLDALWRLVKEKFSTTVPTVDKEKSLWVELTRLFKPNANDVFWKLQRYMHDPLTWKLYTNYGVHHVSSTRRHDIYMLTEKNYPLSNGMMIMMLSAKLQVDKDSEMPKDLLELMLFKDLRKMYYGINAAGLMFLLLVQD